MAELIPYTPSLREKSQHKIAGALKNILGYDNYSAQKIARGFTGTTSPDVGFFDSLGVLDFSPAGLVYAGDEVVRGFQKAQTPLDYAIEGVIGGVTAAEGITKAYPVTKGITNFLRKQVRKFKQPSIVDEITNEQLIGSVSPTNKKELGALPKETIDEEKRKTLKILAAGGAATVVADPLIGALSKIKSTSAPIASNLDGLIGQFAKPIVNTFKTVEGFPFNIKPERMEELIDKSSKASKEDSLKIREDMFDEMNFNQKYEYGILQERVTRSVQLRALEDGAKVSDGDKKYRFGAGTKTIAEPDDVNDISNTVFENTTVVDNAGNITTKKVDENEIKLIDDFYNSLKEQGYTAQEIFDNPQLLNKFDSTTKGSSEFSQQLLSKGTYP